jgi:hypothetical protein
VGYTRVLDLGGERNAYNHLFIWVHPDDPSVPDGLVFDGGPSGNCREFNCGNLTAWASSTGHYDELRNPTATTFFSVQLGSSDNTYAARVLATLLVDNTALQNAASLHPYNPFVGPTSNSVVYTELQTLGIAVPISTANLPLLGNVGVLNYQVNGQTQLFTGWGQSLLP